MPERTPREQHLRNEVGQLTHKIHRMIEDRRQMHADLVRQREDMEAALEALGKGSVKQASDILAAALKYRRDTQQPRRKTSDQRTDDRDSREPSVPASR